MVTCVVLFFFISVSLKSACLLDNIEPKLHMIKNYLKV